MARLFLLLTHPEQQSFDRLLREARCALENAPPATNGRDRKASSLLSGKDDTVVFRAHVMMSFRKKSWNAH